MTEAKLATVHDAVYNAQNTPRKAGSLPMKNYSYRTEESVQNEASAILERHGVTISEFVHHCLTVLVRDYRASDAEQGVAKLSETYPKSTENAQ